MNQIEIASKDFKLLTDAELTQYLPTNEGSLGYKFYFASIKDPRDSVEKPLGIFKGKHIEDLVNGDTVQPAYQIKYTPIKPEPESEADGVKSKEQIDELFNVESHRYTDPSETIYSFDNITREPYERTLILKYDTRFYSAPMQAQAEPAEAEPRDAAPELTTNLGGNSGNSFGLGYVKGGRSKKRKQRKSRKQKTSKRKRKSKSRR
jgi:hypothetical protein